MSRGSTRLSREYAKAMQEYLLGRGGAAPGPAYEAGRNALAEGLGVLEMVAAHQECLRQTLRIETNEREKEKILDRALSCFAESLAPFESVLRDAQESSERLRQGLAGLQNVEEQLRQQNKALALAHGTVQKERQRYQSLFDFAPDGYLVTGLEGAIWEANTAAAAILQTQKDLLAGQSLCEFIVPANRAEFRDCLRALHVGSIERLDDWEVLIQPRSGTPISVALTVMAEGADTAVVCLHWLIRDTTERKRLEKERARRLIGHAKSQTARRFEFLARASALLLESLDVEAGLIAVAHLTASFLSGWCFINVVDGTGALQQLEVANPDRMQADLVDELRCHCLFRRTEPDDCTALPPVTHILEPVTEEWCGLASDGPAHAGLLRRMCGCSGLVLPLRIHGRLVGVLTLVAAPGRRFRSDRIALVQELSRRCAQAIENARVYREAIAERDRAEHASRSKDEFVGILGHELRNSLTPIVGWVRILKNDIPTLKDGHLADGVSSIEKNARTLTRLVDDCLDLARISEGMIRAERKLVDLNQLLAACVQSVRESTPLSRLQLTMEPAGTPVLVLGDATRLEQVAANLLWNAVKYTEAEGFISVRLLADAEYAEVEVRDTGIGIDPVFQEHIFQPFRQGGTSWLTSRSGLGLGLAIARRIVEVHGGRIWAESQGAGRGSTFRVRLPLANLEAQESPGTLPAQEPDVVEDQIRILLVEDSTDILFVMKAEIERLGHTVMTATNGKNGIEAAHQQRPDLIISDIKMPELDGYEFIRAIRRDPELSATPALALTGFGARAEIQRALDAGFNAYLSKPPEPQEIAVTIRHLTEGRCTSQVQQNPA